MKKPTTIAEATAVCPGRYCGGITKVVPPMPDCPVCNGTGYACGVAPTEVEYHLFAIVEAVRSIAGMPYTTQVSRVVDVLEACRRWQIEDAESAALLDPIRAESGRTHD